MIVEAAIRLIELRGAEHLSARTLGTALGADASALYRYFLGMDDLILAVADRLIGTSLDAWEADMAGGGGVTATTAKTGSVEAGKSVDTADWLDSLRSLGRAFYRVYVIDFPQTGRIAASRVTRRANEFRGLETLLGILRQAGFDDVTAVNRLQVLVDFFLGFASLDAGFQSLDPEARTADVEAWRTDYATLSPQTHPHLASVAPLLAEQMTSDSFEPAMELLLAGLAVSPRTVAG